MENAITVERVEKSFKVYLDKGQSFKERLLFRSRRRHEVRQVLKGISFTVARGEAVGLIGHNGCGKSTTLKLLTRILYPDSGTVTMQGRVSSLIELGAGFHPDMSGRENIYTNAAIFGLTKAQIDSRLQSIIDFSELAEFIDNPVRTYSSGMYMRLAFSVAIHVDADILLIDEILGVGDANFQAKCFRRLQQIKAQGTTIVIVSHSLGQIEQICDRSIWIHDGQIRADGPCRDVDLAYLEYMGQAAAQAAQAAQADPAQTPEAAEPAQETESPVPETEKQRYGSRQAVMERITLTGADGAPVTVLQTGGDYTLTVAYRVKKKVENAVFGIGIFRSDGVQVYGTNTRLDRLPAFSLTQDGSFTISLNALPLLPGDYSIDLAIESGELPVDYYRHALQVQVTDHRGDVGTVRLPHTWGCAGAPLRGEPL